MAIFLDFVFGAVDLSGVAALAYWPLDGPWQNYIVNSPIELAYFTRKTVKANSISPNERERYVGRHFSVGLKFNSFLEANAEGN